MTDAWILLAVMLLLLLLVGGVAVSYNLNLSKRVISQFRLLGEKYGLELTIPSRSMAGLYQRNPTLYGKHEGREMSIYPKGYGLDNTRQTDIAIRVITRAPKELAFSLAHKGLTAKLGQLGRLKEVTAGDAKFDETFRLRSNNPGALAGLLNAALLEKIKQSWSTNSGFLSLHSCALEYVQPGLPRTNEEVQKVEEMTALVLEFANSLDAFCVSE